MAKTPRRPRGAQALVTRHSRDLVIELKRAEAALRKARQIAAKLAKAKRLLGPVVLAAALLRAGASSACSCIPTPTVEQEVAMSEAVASGRVVAARLVPGKLDGEKVEDLVATVKVERVWKGNVPETIEVTTAFTCCLCGYGLQVGEKHLLYLYTFQGAFHVTSCGRSAKLDAAAEDLSALGAPLRTYPAE